MTEKISKPNADLEYLNSRLDEVRMSGHARIKAKAQLARAEAMADVLAAAAAGIGRLFRSLTTREPRGTAPSAG